MKTLSRPPHLILLLSNSGRIKGGEMVSAASFSLTHPLRSLKFTKRVFAVGAQMSTILTFFSTTDLPNFCQLGKRFLTLHFFSKNRGNWGGFFCDLDRTAGGVNILKIGAKITWQGKLHLRQKKNHLISFFSQRIFTQKTE